MESLASRLIDLLGGTTAVHQLTKTPISTVHSWRRIGLSEARFDHLRLHAEKQGKLEAFDRIAAGEGEPVQHCPRCNEHVGAADRVTCASEHCPLRVAELENAA